MQANPAIAKNLSKLPVVQMDDTLMTIMLLNEHSIIAVASDWLDDSQESGFCHIVRIDDQWAEA